MWVVDVVVQEWKVAKGIERIYSDVAVLALIESAVTQYRRSLRMEKAG